VLHRAARLIDEEPEDTDIAQPDVASRDVDRMLGSSGRHVPEVIKVRRGSGRNTVECFGLAGAGLVRFRSDAGGMQKYG